MGLIIAGGGSSTPADGSITPAKLSTATKAALVNNGQTGLLVPTVHGVAHANSAVVANRAWFVRFVCPYAVSITGISFVVGAASSVDDPCDAGLYDSSLNRLVSAGATSGKLNSTGTKTLTVASTALTAGTVYYAALSVGTVGGTAANVVMTSGVTGFFAWFGATPPNCDAGFLTSGHPLGTGPITLSGNTSNAPFLVLS